MFKYSKSLKKLLLGLVVCTVPTILCGMGTGKQRVGSARKSAKIVPIELVANAAARRDLDERPSSPMVPVSSRRRQKIEQWAQQNPCITCDAQTGTADGSVSYSGFSTPFQLPNALSDENMPSSSSQNELSQLGSLHERVGCLERLVEENTLATNTSVISCHEKLREVLQSSEDGAAIRSKGKFAQWVCERLDRTCEDCVGMHEEQKQYFVQELTDLHKELEDLKAQSLTQQKNNDMLTQKLSLETEKVDMLVKHTSELDKQRAVIQLMIIKLQRPWWKRCFGCCSRQEDGDVKTVRFADEGLPEEISGDHKNTADRQANIKTEHTDK